MALPIIHIESSRESVVSAGGTDGTYRLESSRSGVQPVTITTDMKADYEKVRDKFGHAFDRFDPLEPFERIAFALDQLTEQDERFA